MGVESEKFKKKWSKVKVGGHTSNEESDEKPKEEKYTESLI